MTLILANCEYLAVAMSEGRRLSIRRQYRLWRAAVDLTQDQVEERARAIYPEFRAGAFWKIENGIDFPSPSERKALARVLKQNESDLPGHQAAEQRVSA